MNDRQFRTRKYELGGDSVKPPKPLNDDGDWHVAGYSIDYGDRSIGFHQPHPYQYVLWEWKESHND
jgi:hypothetical protein